MANKVEKKSKEELENMHTGTLMKRRKALLECEESYVVSVMYKEEEENKPAPGVIQFKDTPEWKQAYEELKSVLSTRENILNKKERKELRQQRAKKKE